jgi:hypothetical protein
MAGKCAKAVQVDSAVTLERRHDRSQDLAQHV